MIKRMVKGNPIERIDSRKELSERVISKGIEWIDSKEDKVRPKSNSLKEELLIPSK